jgi:anaerobic ribonucleoside-triphosphate reductase activating protein
MLQAAGLAEVARTARQCRDVSVVCFTGYTLERLRSRPPAPAIDELLAEVDVLVDGPYVAERDTGVGMRGSDNQRVHYLPGRIRPADHDFEGVSRAVEIRVTSDDESAQVLLVGVPPHGLRERLDVVQQRVLDLVGGAA